MIGAAVVLYNPSINEVNNINSYVNSVDYVVVFDNSDVNNYDLISKYVSEYEKIIYMSEEKNLGLCVALNKAIDTLSRLGCDWALLFDADSKLGCDLVEVYSKAITSYQDEKVALFAPVHVFDRSQNHPYEGYKTVDWSMTSGWLVNIDVFQKQGGFFEKLFVDGLDMDYCFKSIENGYKIIECGQAVIVHNPAQTKTIKFGNKEFKYGFASPFRYYMQARQLIWVAFRYKKVKILGVYCYKWFKVIFLFPNKSEYVKNMVKGTIDGMHQLKEKGKC